MLLSLANPETFETWKAQYRHKLALLLLVFLLMPASPDVSPHSTPSTSSPSSSHTVADDHRRPSLTSTNLIPPIVGPSQIDSLAPLAAPSNSPLTAASSSDRQVAVDFGEPKRAMPVKGSTTTPEGTPVKNVLTPPLSDPPAALASHARAKVDSLRPDDTSSASPPEFSTTTTSSSSSSSSSSSLSVVLDESECPIDFRGRPMCPGVEREHPSFSARSAELSSEFADAVHEFGLWLLTTLSSSIRITISPFFLFCLLVHALSLSQLIALIVEDTIVRTSLANPLPADFPRATTLSKRISRLRWRIEASWRRFSRSLLVLTVIVAGVGSVSYESRWGPRHEDGWVDVPFAQLVIPNSLEDAGRKLGRQGPLRDLIMLETLSTMLYLLQPIKHLLPSSILPATFAPPSSLYPPTPVSVSASNSIFPPIPHDPSTLRKAPRHCAPVPQLQLDTPWLISLFVDVSSALLSLLQLVRCAFLLPTISPLTLPPHFIFHLARGRINTIVMARQNLLRTIECLHAVFKLFPEDRYGVGAGDEDTAEEPDWVCTICFEGAEEEASLAISKESSTESQHGPRTVTIRAKCRLPCGHKYHAGCLTQWFHHQTFCPCCHVPVSASTPMSSPPPSTPNSPRQPLFGLPLEEEDLSDLYPAELARRRRGGTSGELRRRRRVDEVREEDPNGGPAAALGLELVETEQ